MSSEFASALTGRHAAIELLPFSYREFLETGVAHSETSFERYLVEGGSPQVAIGLVEARAYLSTLWDAIILKDVVRRHKVRNVAALNDVYSLLLNAVASKFNYDSLARSNYSGISSPTIKKFVRYAREASLPTELEQFSFATRKRIKSDRKVYAFDTGFVTAKRVSISSDWGKLLENAVFLELLRRGARHNIDLFYYVTKSGFEVDFLRRDPNGKNQELIQVAWIMSEQKTKEREMRALHEASRELGVNDIKILTANQKELYEYKGVKIEVIPTREWLVT